MMRDALSQPAGEAEIAAFAFRNGMTHDAARAALDDMRSRQLALRRADPYNFGYEPPIWFVTKALFRNPYWSDYERHVINKRFGGAMTAEEFARRIRRALGFAAPVTKVLVMGSNRSGKTDFAAKFCVQAMMVPDHLVCSGAQTHLTQKKNQMSRVWKYLSIDLKKRNIATKKAKDAKENISYTDKNGFAGSRITLGTNSKLDFITYEQNITSLEGVEYDQAHLDEEYPKGFYDLLSTRITSRAGQLLCTFTPLSGYTAAIAAFLSDAVVTRWHNAYLRPIDGGEREPWNELHLSREEYNRLVDWRRHGMEGDCCVPESRPEDCFNWIYQQQGDCDGATDSPRKFDRVPRVAVCQGGEAAAIWFYGSDNPYGLPSELIIEKMSTRDSDKKIYASVYGMAREMKGRIFSATFDRKRNVVPAAEVPRKLVRFMVIDPAPNRNWCIGWYGYDPLTQTLYKYREWPGHYEVPGQGVPGDWAVPSDKNNGHNDGARGEAQESFGFGYEQYRDEVRRVEGGEQMEFRLLDSRAAAQTKVSATKSQTLIEELEEYFDGLTVADGQRLEVGYSRMHDKFTSGKYKISDACVNTIQCYDLLTGADGQKGAAKDMIDCDRYAVMSDTWHYDADAAKEINENAAEDRMDKPEDEQPMLRNRPSRPGARRVRLWCDR